MPVKEVDRPKTAFVSPWGKFEYIRMPFGVRNGPSVFQRLTDVLLNNVKGYAQNYIDDIIVFGASWEDHLQQVDDVLEQAGLTVNEDKHLWAQTACEFLGHFVGGARVSPSESIIQAIKDFAPRLPSLV